MNFIFRNKWTNITDLVLLFVPFLNLFILSILGKMFMKQITKGKEKQNKGDTVFPFCFFFFYANSVIVAKKKKYLCGRSSQYGSWFFIFFFFHFFLKKKTFKLGY